MRLISISVGKVSPLFGNHHPDYQSVASAIRKNSISNLQNLMTVEVTNLGIKGDEQADLSVHGGIEKAIQFSQAKALLFPIQWEEPFGLVVIEALLSGTPVIATRRGSMPELINDRVGYIFDEDEEFPEALSHATSCKSSDCRDWAMNYFSSSVCSQNYLALYERVILNKVNWNDADL